MMLRRSFHPLKSHARRTFSYLPMSDKTIKIIRATTPVVAPHVETITKTFYPLLFKNNPEALAFFNKTHQSRGQQQTVLADAVTAYASNIDHLSILGPAVYKIGQRHCALGVTPELYKIVHDNLMLAIVEVLGDAVTPDVGEAWSNAVMALSEILIGEEEKMYQEAEKRAGGWRGFKPFTLVKKSEVGEETVSFDFQTDDHKGGYEFSAGQYLSIRLPESSGVLAPRHYTVTSSSGDKSLQCTTRKVLGSGHPDGAVSTYMHDVLIEGDTVSLSAPFGVFTPERTFQKEPVSLVTAGIGITPALSLSRVCAPSQAAGALHADRSNGHCGTLTNQLERNLGGAQLQKIIGASHNEVAAAIKKFGAGQLERSADMHFVVCGPMGFMQSAVKELTAAGAKNIHHEVFGTGSVK